MKKAILIFNLLFILSMVSAQVDTIHHIKVKFLYGSKPKRAFKSTEPKEMGGLHGGHVSIEVDDIDYGFEPITDRVHIFPRKKCNSDYLKKYPGDSTLSPKDSKTVTFIIPITNAQYNQLNQIHQCYVDSTPCDYAFFGMRCASTVQEILGEIGIVKKRNRVFNIVSTFYPKRLRKRMFRLAKKNNYEIIKTEGKSTRIWEKD